MYQLTCDGLPLLDWRDNDLVLVNPRVKLEVNTVGEGSFTIYKNHPHYNSLKKLKSVFEVSDDFGVIFRGRATRDTIDFDQGMLIDMEGAMAFFNDSIVRPFNFPGDFQVTGDRVAFFLGWLIDNHNAQLQDFQKMKLGNVTVKDPKLVRSSSDYTSTWDMLKAKLFDSSLGGYLCIRYEEDGNYIDYLSEFTETNNQEIILGENLLDLKTETESSGVYSAIIPFGALGLTIEGLADGNITDDIVKTGDTLYSKKLVEQYGWIYASTTATTWDDVVDDADLLTVGVDFLTNGGAMPINGIEATAVDLHFTDKQVESLRIYKNVSVHSAAHKLTESFPLAKLEIELLNPQNTKITVSKTIKTLTEKTALQQEEAKKKYSKLSKNDEEIRLEVKNELEGLSSEFSQTVENLTFAVTNGEDTSTIKLMSGKTEIDSAEIKMTGCIQTGTISANRIDVQNLNLSGVISFSDLADYEEVQTQIDSAGGLSENEVSTLISDELIASPTIAGGTIIGSTIYAAGEDSYFEVTDSGFALWGTGIYDTKPKIELEHNSDLSFVRLMLGAGSEAYQYSDKGRLLIEKDADAACIWYFSETSGNAVGFSFFNDGTIKVSGTLVDASGNPIGG